MTRGEDRAEKDNRKEQIHAAGEGDFDLRVQKTGRAVEASEAMPIGLPRLAMPRRRCLRSRLAQ